MPEVDFQMYNSAGYVSPVLLDAKQVATGEKSVTSVPHAQLRLQFDINPCDFSRSWKDSIVH